MIKFKCDRCGSFFIPAFNRKYCFKCDNQVVEKNLQLDFFIKLKKRFKELFSIPNTQKYNFA